MTVNAILQLTILPIRARIKPGKEGNGFFLLFGRLVVVLEAAIVAFGTRTPQIVVVAQLIVFFSGLDLVHNCFRIQDRRVEASRPRVPSWRERFVSLSHLSCCWLGLWWYGQRHLRRRRRALDHRTGSI